MTRVGIIGTDSTHTLEFTRLLNRDRAFGTYPAKVVAACHGAQTDFPLSVARRDKITAELECEFGVPILSTSQLMSSVDAVMVLSCDGRRHQDEVVPLLGARKPVFVDKPLAADWRAAASILRTAKELNCPCFSASALRYRARPTTLDRSAPVHLKSIVPARTEPGHPDLSWHGIHGVESVYSILGAGCQSVRRQINSEGDLTLGAWADGSTATIERDSYLPADFPLTITILGDTHFLKGFSYADLTPVLAAFFATRVSPVPAAETSEIFAFIAASDISRDSGGRPVALTSLLSQLQNCPVALSSP